MKRMIRALLLLLAGCILAGCMMLSSCRYEKQTEKEKVYPKKCRLFKGSIHFTILEKISA